MERQSTMEYEKIVQRIKESPVMLVGIGAEFQIDADAIGAEPDSLEYAERICRLADTENGYSILKPYVEGYRTLKRLIEGKDYFIVSTNTDGMLEHMDFPAERTVSPCGSVYRMQCENTEHGVWSIETAWREGRPLTCPVCAREGRLNIIKNKPYNESGYLKQWEAYTKWLQRTINKEIFILELGEGFETPTVMRWPFEKIVYINQKAAFARVNSRLPQISEEIKERAFSVKENSLQFMGRIAELLNS